MSDVKVEREQSLPTKEFEKPHLERIGLFEEMGYLRPDGLKERILEGTYLRQIMSCASKSKCATADGYFAEFQRLYEGDCSKNEFERRMKYRSGRMRRRLEPGYWTPAGIERKYPTEEFADDIKTGKLREPRLTVRESALPNVITNPGKKGVGYGYLDVTIASYPKYISEPEENPIDVLRRINENHRSLCINDVPFIPSSRYPPHPTGTELYSGIMGLVSSRSKETFPVPFLPSSVGKRLGGGKHGCLDRFPKHLDQDPYQQRKFVTRELRLRKGDIAMKPSGSKETHNNYPIQSTIKKTVWKKLNSKNRRYLVNESFL